jgi:hypothetical protein
MAIEKIDLVFIALSRLNFFVLSNKFEEKILKESRFNEARKLIFKITQHFFER